MGVAHLLVEAHDIACVVLPPPREDAGLGGVAGKEVGDVIGRTAHQTERVMRPGLGEMTLGCEVGGRLGNLETTQHRTTGSGRCVGHALSIGRVSCHIVELGHRGYGAAKRGVRGDILDPLAIDKDRAAIFLQARHVLGTGTQGRRLQSACGSDCGGEFCHVGNVVHEGVLVLWGESDSAQAENTYKT